MNGNPPGQTSIRTGWKMKNDELIYMPTKKTTKKETRKEIEPKVKKETKTAPKKEVEVKVEVETSVLEEAPKNNKSEKYFEAMGGRKESSARVRLYTKKATDQADEDKALIIVNGKDYREYFSDKALWEIVESPLKKLKSTNRFKVTVVVHGGGKSGQAGAIRHGIALTLVDFDQNFRKKLKKSGYLTRDPRAKERRKYGLKKARKAPRWAKR